MSYKESPFKRTQGKLKSKPAAPSEFYDSLVNTGKPDWKKAPKEFKTRAFGVYAILVAIPVLFISSYEIYRRLEGKSTKKVQQGEMLKDRSIRKFDEDEKMQVEESSIMYKLFGKDFFLDGTTSKTLPKDFKDK